MKINRKQRYALITTDGTVRTVEADLSNLLKLSYDLLDCDCIETAKIPIGTLVMIVDESGKLKDKPVNRFATLLYGAPQDFIVGDVLIGDIYSEDIYGLQHANELILKAFAEQLGFKVLEDLKYD